MTDIPDNLVRENNIMVVPLTVIFKDGEYRDGIDLTKEEFYNKLSNQRELPKTSQVSPNTFMQVFQELLEDGKEIICVNASSRASGTYQAAVMAKNELQNDKIHVFDSMALCYGAGFFVLEAAKMARSGLSVEKIFARLNELKGRVDHIFTVDTLEYLKKGGRINPMKATIATVLNVKPILTVVEGLVEPLDKVRGSRKVIGKMMDLAQDRGRDFSEQTVAVAHANNLERAEELMEAVKKELKPKKVILTEIGCTIGTHAGPGTVAIFYYRKSI